MLRFEIAVGFIVFPNICLVQVLYSPSSSLVRITATRSFSQTADSLTHSHMCLFIVVHLCPHIRYYYYFVHLPLSLSLSLSVAISLYTHLHTHIYIYIYIYIYTHGLLEMVLVFSENSKRNTHILRVWWVTKHTNLTGMVGVEKVYFPGCKLPCPHLRVPSTHPCM